ncbi:MAG: hypothetical protein H0U35_05970 [Sporichthyaceae bacterium]|nr:hypothetical protein [Sporichthyaceae bacterium]
MRGAAAGAAGTTALNAVTYLDMTWRGRPASSTPEDTVEKGLGQTSLDLPGEGETRANRVSALGALSGLATGVAIGAAYGAVRALGVRPPVLVSGLVTAAVALAGSNAPMTAMGVTDPRSWSTADWVADVVPHLAYGLVTAWSYCAPED